MKFFAKSFILIIFVLRAVALPGYNIKEISKFQLSQAKTLIAYPMSFCVTEDELFLVTDLKLGHIKIYDNKGSLIKILGRKGFGPLEFDRPGASFYEERKYGVLDFTTWRVHLYQRTGKTDFKRVESIFCHTSSTNIHFKKNKIYLGGFHTDAEGKKYSFLSVDVATKKVELLMPIYYKFKLRSHKEYNASYLSPEIQLVGIRNVFALGGNYAFYMWEGDLSVVRIDLTGGEITRFGHKTSNYLKPFISRELEKSYETRRSNSRAFGDARKKMSFVHEVLACDRYVMPIYRGPIKNAVLLPYWAQFYTLEGKFINEIKLPEYEWARFYLDRENNILYGLASFEDEDYVMVKMKIYQEKGNKPAKMM